MAAPKRTMSATEFRARCLEVLGSVGADGSEVAIGKRALVVARVVPVRPERARWPFPDMSHLLQGEIGDVVTPLPLTWKAAE